MSAVEEMETLRNSSSVLAEEEILPDDSFITASVVLYNNENELVTLLSSLQAEIGSYGSGFHLYVIDNSKQCRCQRICAQHDFVTLIANDENIGFGAAHNQIIPHLASKYHIVINPDIVFTGDAIPTLIAFLEKHGDVAMATCEITYPDGSVQRLPKRKPSFRYLVGRRFSREGRENCLTRLASEYCMKDRDGETVSNIEFCTGCFFVIRTSVYREVGGFDESYFMYFEDADLTQRVLRQGDAVIVRSCNVIHDWQGGSRRSIRLLSHHIKSMFRFMGKYGWR